jgi:DNA mismatch endonuclease, patch repair protein
MTDVLTKNQRSYCMSRIRGKDTTPEIYVRKIVFSMGYRYRLHVQNMPGSPDLVFPAMKKVIFVNGCFWHLHKCRLGNVFPNTNRQFWRKKLMNNKARDIKNISLIRRSGWKVLIVWECEIKVPGKIIRRLLRFLSNS